MSAHVIYTILIANSEMNGIVKHHLNKIEISKNKPLTITGKLLYSITIEHNGYSLQNGVRQVPH